MLETVNMGGMGRNDQMYAMSIGSRNAAALLEGKMDNGSDDKKSGGKARRR